MQKTKSFLLSIFHCFQQIDFSPPWLIFFRFFFFFYGWLPSNQSILKEISLEYSLEGLILKLQLQYFGYLMRRTDLLEKTLMLERLKAGEGDDREWDVGWHHRLNGHELVQTLRGREGQRSLACCNPWGLKKLDPTERLNNKTVPFFCRNLTNTARKILFPWNY